MCQWIQREPSEWFRFGWIPAWNYNYNYIHKCKSVPVVLSCRSSSTYCLVSVQVHVRFTLCHIVGWTGKSEYYQHCHKWIINCVVPSVFDWEERLYSKLSPTHSRTSEDSFHCAVCYSNVHHNETIFQSLWKYIHHSNYGECNFAQYLKVVNL